MKNSMIPLLLAHVVCCGGIFLIFIVGSAGLTAIGGMLRDPLVQVVGVVLLAIALVAFWQRRGRKPDTRMQTSPIDGETRGVKSLR